MSSTKAFKILIQKREQIIDAINRFESYLENEEFDYINLKARLNNFEAILEKFNDIDIEIKVLDENDTGAVPAEEFESRFYAAITKANRALLSQVQETKIEIKPDLDTRLIQRTRLPTIDLPKFSGEYHEWFPFQDTFSSIINQDESITPIQRLQYLKASLTGDAAILVQSLEVKAENYAVAWSILKDRYDNKRLVIQKHVHALLELPTVHKSSLVNMRLILDGLQMHLRALSALKCPTESWDDLLVPLIALKLDSNTLKDWEGTLTSTETPKVQQLIKFLSQKCSTMEIIAKRANNYGDSSSNHQKFRKNFAHLSMNKPKGRSCEICAENHLVYQCNAFSKMTVGQRLEKIKEKRLCLNCFRSDHTASNCQSRKCKHCSQNHHSLLHFPKTPAIVPGSREPATLRESSTSQEPSTSSNSRLESANLHCLHASETREVLLSTAIVLVSDCTGNKHECRALLDSGSQSNFVTSAIANRLKLTRSLNPIQIVGVNQSSSAVTQSVQLTVTSRYNSYQTDMKCLVLERITGQLPRIPIAMQHMHIPKNIKLADPNFNVPGEIDLLIGADTFWNLLCVGQIKTPGNHPMLQKTHFGWITTGARDTSSEVVASTLCNLSLSESLERAVERLWKVDEVLNDLSSEQNDPCETHFKRTHSRSMSGRFIVSLPFKTDPTLLGNSRAAALRRFLSLEKRLYNDNGLREEYIRFMREYIELGHMRLIPNPDDNSPHFYLPHHAVLKESSLTTKLRVVFDGSAQTSTGLSLNSTLMVGPILQPNLISILLRFRTYKYVLTADVEKMYRQISMTPEDTKFQRIFWRENNTGEVSCYELQTVTYGTASASFLAIRSLQQTAREHTLTHPLGAKIILRDFYVDDLLTGANSHEELISIREEVSHVLGTACFNLRKWASNSASVLASFDCQKRSDIVPLTKDQLLKTLGLNWHPINDTLIFAIKLPVSKGRYNKRTILSEISEIFDPLGLISPVTIKAKILLQELWLLKLSWDESIPLHIHTSWSEYRRLLPLLNNLQIPRNAIPYPYDKLELHGFCDASKSAYGACIYIKAFHMNTVSVNLLTSKSRVAPLKEMTIPRLELCAAVLLAQLFTKVINDLNLPFESCHFWSDSTIVLAWLKRQSRTLNTFVANRISEIQTLTDIKDWHHVPTNHNPADLITRGIDAVELLRSKLWWHGPEWLPQDCSEWPIATACPVDDQQLPEMRQTIQATISFEAHTALEFDIFVKYSSFSKLIRVTAYCARFIHNARFRLDRRIGFLKSQELAAATNCLVRLLQSYDFDQDIRELRRNKQVTAQSKLVSLSPFLCDNGILRVGGRLRNSDLPYSVKHPAILPARHPFTIMLIRHTHEMQLHAGCTATLAAIRQKFWPLSARNTVKSVIRQCIVCFRVNPRSSQPVMGDFPKHRVTPARPFSICGVDYAGPFTIKEGFKRSKKTSKAYVALFVCFLSKAIHLELVSDLSTDAFIATLRRFIARRGMVSDIYSDNATNFVGANNCLKEFTRVITAEKSLDKFAHVFPHINWHFIPASSPHFGGLWEAGVKSVKYHIRRVAGNTLLNFEEMCTLLAQIEAIVNSRPLVPLSSDPNDYSFISPGHFLIGDTFSSVPEADLQQFPLNRLSSWQHIQRIKQHFWSRWTNEYLGQLNCRSKWKQVSDQPGLQLGQLVILREDCKPPLSWRLGRILDLHSGSDGVSRVATVQTSSGTILKRATNRICLLPIPSADTAPHPK